MPTYSYRCTQCETAFDIHQAFTDASLTDCPTCQGRLRKVFSSIGVTFNGSGFYRTDSRVSGNGKTKGTTDASSATSTSGSSASGSSASGSSEKAGAAASSSSRSTGSGSSASSAGTSKAAAAS